MGMNAHFSIIPRIIEMSSIKWYYGEDSMNWGDSVTSAELCRRIDPVD
jgi:hypothetical protein